MANARPLRFMALPGPIQRAACDRALTDTQLRLLLGGDLFPIDLLHQSLSLALPDNARHRKLMMSAGDSLSAVTTPVTYSRIKSTGRAPHPVHWAFRSHGRVPEFDSLVANLDHAMAEHGLMQDVHPTAHMTCSYHAPSPLPVTPIAPIEWTIETVQLTVRCDNPFRYDVIASWPLRNGPMPPVQHSLF